MNARQAKFVAGVLAGKTQVAAYTAAGYAARGDSAARAATRLAAEPEVAAALGTAKQEVVQAATEAAKADIPWVIDQLKSIAENGDKDSARVSALKLLGDHLGVWAPKKVDLRQSAQLVIIEEIVDPESERSEGER